MSPRGDQPSHEAGATGVHPASAALVAAVVGACTFLTFAGVLRNGFVDFDTIDYVLENEHIRSFSAENIRWMFQRAHSGNWHPLTWLSHALDYRWYGLEPRGHHLTSLLIHTLNAICTFWLFLLIARRVPVLGRRALLAAGIGALLHAVHPLRVESVAWVAERKDVLCQFFSLITLIFYLLAAGRKTPRGRFGWLLAALLAFGLALMSKPMAVTLPVVMLILDVFPLGRIRISTALRLQGGVRPLLPVVAEKLPFLAMAGVMCAVTVWAQRTSSAIATVGMIDFGTRAANALMALVFYFGKLLVPVNLSLFYEVLPIRALRGPVGSGMTAALVLALVWFSVRAWRLGRKHWLVALAFLLVTISPVIGLAFVGWAGAADRYTYMPFLPYFALAGFGLAGGLAGAAGAAGEGRRLIRAGRAFAVLLLVATLGWLTVERVKDWRSNLTIWEAAVKADPDCFESHVFLGLARKKVGDVAGSIRAYERALSMRSAAERSAVVSNYRRAGRVSIYGVVYLSLADSRSKVDDKDGAIRDYLRILEERIPVAVKPAAIYYQLADLFHRKQSFQQARRALEEALQLEPGLPDPLRLRAALAKAPR